MKNYWEIETIASDEKIIVISEDSILENLRQTN